MYIINHSNHIANTVDNVEINIFMPFLTFFLFYISQFNFFLTSEQNRYESYFGATYVFQTV